MGSDSPQQLNLGLHHEDTVEMYYNAALTPWLNATADLQIVNPVSGVSTSETDWMS